METKKIIMVIAIMAILVVLTGCAKDISKIKNESYVGKKVTIAGTSEGSIKLGMFSGYTVKDDTGSIFVASTSLPADKSKVRVSGTVKTFLGQYYIESE